MKPKAQHRAFARSLDAAGRANSRKKAGPPDPVKTINRTERLLRETIRRAGLPPSLARQGARMVGHYAHKRQRGFQAVWPGMEKMAEWGECGERMARKNFAQLEAGEVIRRVGAAKGGRRMACEWIVESGGLRKWLILIGANPSPTLFDLLDTILIGGAPRPETQRENPELATGKTGTGDPIKPDMEGAEIDPETRNQNPELNPELSSARSREIGHRHTEAANAAPAKRRRGGK